MLNKDLKPHPTTAFIPRREARGWAYAQHVRQTTGGNTMTTILQLKKQLQKAKETGVQSLQEANESLSSGGNDYGDPRELRFGKNQKGEIEAKIRFLPNADGDECNVPFAAKYFYHSFKIGEGNWYIENSRTSLGEPDPMQELVTRLREQGASVEQLRPYQRKQRFAMNVWVREDANSDVTGHRIWHMPMTVYRRIADMAEGGSFQTPELVVDYFEGRDFIVRMTKDNKFWTYDSSSWDDKSQIFNDDDEILKLHGGLYPLSEFCTDSDFYKSYDKLKDRLITVGLIEGGGAPVEPDPEPTPAPQEKEKSQDEVLDFFKGLASGD